MRAHGYDIVRKLDARIGLAKRHGATVTEQHPPFHESLRIQVDESATKNASDR